MNPGIEHRKPLQITKYVLHILFGRINNFFGAIKDKRRLKILEYPVNKYITNASFLDNLLVMTQGCNANQSFNLNSPTI